MDRRLFVRLSAALAATAMLERSAVAAAAGAEDERLRALLDTFLDEVLNERPQSATGLGLDDGSRTACRSRLDDYSSQGPGRWLASCKSRLERLRRIDRAQLSANAQVNRDVVDWWLGHIVAGTGRFPFGEVIVTGYSPYVFSQLSGPYQSVPDFLDAQHPVRTVDDAEAYLARLAAFSAAIDASTEALRVEAARGVLAPDFTLDTGIGQVAKLRAGAAADNGLVTSLSQRAARAGLAGEWGARAAAIVDKQIHPALDRQRELAMELRRNAKHDAGVWILPDGEAYYAAALAFQTTTERTPKEVHRLGLDQVSEISARLDKLLRAQGYAAGSVAARVQTLSRRPDQLFPNDDAGREALLSSLRAQAEAVRARLPQAFRTLPAAPLEIVRVPPEIQDGAPLGYAQIAPLDGSRPGRYYINLKDTANWPKLGLPTLTYHEAFPGHQWQGAIALAAKETPLLRTTVIDFDAYGEGWALYSEQLADELGMYEDNPLGRIGYLQSMLFRAVRLVVDSGMHALRWSRERAIAYMIEVTALPESRARGEIDRYCIWPGQACTYKIGHLEWLRAREIARARAGARFDLRAFHEILRRGAMPLAMLTRIAQDYGSAI
jgi:uncharacterized protein (DUF885 family)